MSVVGKLSDPWLVLVILQGSDLEGSQSVVTLPPSRSIWVVSNPSVVMGERALLSSTICNAGDEALLS